MRNIERNPNLNARVSKPELKAVDTAQPSLPVTDEFSVREVTMFQVGDDGPITSDQRKATEQAIFKLAENLMKNHSHGARALAEGLIELSIPLTRNLELLRRLPAPIKEVKENNPTTKP